MVTSYVVRDPFMCLRFTLLVACGLFTALGAVDLETRPHGRQGGPYPLQTFGSQGIHGFSTERRPDDHGLGEQTASVGLSGNLHRRNSFPGAGAKIVRDEEPMSTSCRVINQHLDQRLSERPEKRKWRSSRALVRGHFELDSNGIRPPRELTTFSSARLRAGGYTSSDRLHSTDGGTRAEPRSQVPGPWVVPRDVRVKNSELEAGRQQLLALAKKMMSVESHETKTPLFDPSAVTRQVVQAARRMFPLDSVYHCRDDSERFRVLGVGQTVGTGSSGVVCLAADLTDLASSTRLAAKFFYLFLPSGRESRTDSAKRCIAWRVNLERLAREKVLSKGASEQELARHGISVPRGFYRLDWARRHPPRRMDIPLVSKLPSGKGGYHGSSVVLFSREVMIMPLLGPDLGQFSLRDYTDDALKYIVATSVRSVAYLHELGLVHRDVKPNNFAVSAETGQPFLTDLEFSEEAGTKSSCRAYLVWQYADPERAACVVESDGEFIVDEWADSWALGISLFYVLCDGLIPFGALLVSTETDSLESQRTRLRVLLENTKRENFQGDACPFLNENRAPLLDIIKLLLDPHKPTRWTARKLAREHPFFQVVQD